MAYFPSYTQMTFASLLIHHLPKIGRVSDLPGVVLKIIICDKI